MVDQGHNTFEEKYLPFFFESVYSKKQGESGVPLWGFMKILSLVFLCQMVGSYLT